MSSFCVEVKYVSMLFIVLYIFLIFRLEAEYIIVGVFSEIIYRMFKFAVKRLL